MPCKFNNGEFEVGKKLGDGTYGEIYTATSKKDAKAVVLKVIPFLTDKRKMSFLRESSISRKLHTQRNIIAVDSCYYNDKVGVLVMEKMDCDLLEFIMRKNSLPERLSKLLFRDICKALYQCHSNGISHLDIKPDNILLKIKDPSTSSSSSSSDGVKDEEQSNYEVEYVKLADFGFSYDFSTRARKSNGNNNNNLIDFNFEFDQLVGTAQYRAPEAKNAPHSSYLADKVDMWGLGITLFCMITGSFPFADVNGKLVSNDFNLVKKKCKDEKCFDLVTNLLQFNPLDRFDILQTLSHPWLSD